MHQTDDEKASCMAVYLLILEQICYVAKTGLLLSRAKQEDGRPHHRIQEDQEQAF